MTDNDDSNPLEELQELVDMMGDKHGGTVVGGPEFTGSETGDAEESWEFEFDYTPDQIKTHLDRYVIGQEAAKRQLASTVCYHYRQAAEEVSPYYQKENLLMVGNTGVGKTHLVEVLSDFLDVPYVRADATKFSATGYAGKNVESLVRDLAEKADRNLEKAEHGIIFLDEVDKICSSQEQGRDVSGRDVQTNLLKLLEQTEVSLVDPSNPASMVKNLRSSFAGKSADETLDTANILFIASGAFPGLEEIVSDRLNRGTVGFTSSPDGGRQVELLEQCEPVDLMEFGLEAEFVGRFPVVTFLADLDENDLFQILKHSESSILRQYREDFATYGIQLDFTDPALREVAERAIDSQIGARGLTSELERVLVDALYSLPAEEVEKVEVTREMVREPDEVVERVLVDRLLEEEIRGQFKSHDIEVKIDDSAREALVTLASQPARSPGELFEEKFKSLHHFFRQLDRDEIKIGEEFVEAPEEKLNELCEQHFGQDEATS